jgi:RecA/RadA recombinase
LKLRRYSVGGGVPTGSISELVGPAGAGKTQMCLTLAVAAAAPVAAGGLGGGVVFIDTEQKFSGVRLAEIARAKFPHVYGRDAPFDAAQAALAALTARQGLTLVHFSAQPGPFLTQNHPEHPLSLPISS